MRGLPLARPRRPPTPARPAKPVPQGDTDGYETAPPPATTPLPAASSGPQPSTAVDPTLAAIFEQGPGAQWSDTKALGPAAAEPEVEQGPALEEMAPGRRHSSRRVRPVPPWTRRARVLRRLALIVVADSKN